ncbi:MAG: EAL domain-containing protein, partial [Sulfuricurvum sp.]|nr:EAL domain-containing protein [Sulfuricurvum sp.]
FGVAVLDFSHVISYTGMPEFVTPSGIEKAIYFWLAARILSSVGLLLFLFFPINQLSSKIYNYSLLAMVLILIGVVHWLVLFNHALFLNVFFIPGQGLTPLKINTEYAIVVLNLITAIVLLRRMRQPQPYHAAALFGALCIMAMSEFFFTLYADVTDVYNIFGHIYKAIAYLFVYRAIFVTTVKKPYKELSASQNQLHERNRLLDSIIDNIPNMLFLKTASELRFVLFNKAGEKLLGLNRDNLIGHNDYDFFPKEEADFFTDKDRETLKRNELLDIYEESIQTPHGIRILHTKKVVIRDENGVAKFLLGISEDITDHKQAENSLLKLSLAVEQSPNSIVITDLIGNIEYVNTMFTTITGYTKDEILGENPRILKSNKTPQSTYDDMWNQLSQGNTWHGELINLRKDKSEYIESATISPVKQADGTIINYVAIKENITDKKRIEEHIENLAHYDQLTGLPNRVLLSDRIKYLLNHAQRNEETVAVMFLDLDHFKNINDTLGHTIGDQLLIEIAQRLKAAIRDEDTVSRLGGDEFILLFPDTDVNEAMHIATKLIEAVSIPCTIEHHELVTTPSIGIAIYPYDGEDFETLLKNADTAMYQAKRFSRNAFHFFTQEMQLHSARNLQLVNALRHALERNELQLHYQPQISTQDGRIIGAEALLRWTHPKLGMISPAEFIPIAEDSGQIIQIGEWVLRTAVHQMKAWKENGFNPMVIAVNLSAVQFQQKNIVELITNILDEAQLPHEYLELELTEAVTMNNPQSAIAVMNRLHAQGIRMSIDDFGTGYSSLSYLKQFKVYKLKIDQSFIRNIADDPEDQAIVRAIIDMAKSLGLQTIAEGVETAQQLAFLRHYKCNEIQGYYYSKPLSVVEFENFFKSSVSVTP